MAKKFFVNLPVKDLKKSIEFFTGIGFTLNPLFTDDNAACIIISENIFAMLLTEKTFGNFTKKEIADAAKTTEVLMSIDAESREEVNKLVEAAKAAGGTLYSDAADYGWMYLHGFADPDGHQWEVFCMDESKMPEEMIRKGKENENRISIVVETLINAPADKLWELWTEPEHITKWNNASDDWHTPRAENDLRAGGKFLSRMEARDGSAGFDFEGTYTNVKPNERIEYVLADGRKVKIEFNQEGNKCRITEIFDAEYSNPAQMQKKGWQSILDNFKKYAEKSV